MNIYLKKGIQFIISTAYQINKQNRKVYNFLKKEFEGYLTIF